MRRRRWARQEDLAVLYVKIEYGGELRSPQNNPIVQALAGAMERTVASVSMRIANFNSLDDFVPIRGLSNVSSLTAGIWSEYVSDPERIRAESKEAFEEFLSF